MIRRAWIPQFDLLGVSPAYVSGGVTRVPDDLAYVYDNQGACRDSDPGSKERHTWTTWCIRRESAGHRISTSSRRLRREPWIQRGVRRDPATLDQDLNRHLDAAGQGLTLRQTTTGQALNPNNPSTVFAGPIQSVNQVHVGQLLEPRPDRRLVTDPLALLIVNCQQRGVGALGSAARHLRGLVGRAREAGLAVVLATQGPSDLEAVDRALLPQVLQDTAWQLAFRQGSPQDAERMQALFGHAYVEDLTRYSDGRFSTRHVERPRVRVDEWMNALEPGDAWLRVAPIDRGWRQERVRVALPSSRSMGSVSTSVNASVTKPDTLRPALTESAQGADGGASVVSGFPSPGGNNVLPPVPPDCPQELVRRMGADVLAKVERRWPKRRHELGPCLVWTGPKGPDAETGPYGRIYDSAIGKAVQRFAVALFEGVQRTAVDARSLSLDELRQMLSRFEVLNEKRRGRCWSRRCC